MTSHTPSKPSRARRTAPVRRARTSTRAPTSIDVYPDADRLAEAAATLVVRAADDAISRRGRFLWCLSGGQTPAATYRLLATPGYADRVAWHRCHVFFADERCVPPDHEASNFRMARDTLLDHVPIPADAVHRIAGELDPPLAAAAYETLLHSFLDGSIAGGPASGFDLLLLGMGTDGHTASLFPHSRDEPERWVSPRRAPAGSWRVSLTPGVLNTARATRLIVTGAGKADRLADALSLPRRPADLPVQRIDPAGELRWMSDRAAAGRFLTSHQTRQPADVEVKEHP